MDLDRTGVEGLAPGARVVVAMSGGVDSSLVAAHVKALGYETIGVTLQLYNHGAAVNRAGSCCAGQDIHDARRVANQLGIAHYVLDYESRFRDAVMADFAASYAAGSTPVPCVRCNQRIKFGDLLAMARMLGAEALATGHYARRVMGPEGPELHAAADGARDQSYFLFATTPEALAFVRFPLGHLAKPTVRAEAERWGLAVAAKPDSQDICFVPTGRYATVVERLRPGSAEPGDIVDEAGRVLGRHEGIIHFTVGQRRGLGLSGGPPVFVLALDAARRRVVVGPREALVCRRFALDEFNWLGSMRDRPTPGGPEIEVRAKVRSTRPPVSAFLALDEAGGPEVHIPAGEEAVAPGQACVLYGGGADASRVLGGGIIRRPEARAALGVAAVRPPVPALTRTEGAA